MLPNTNTYENPIPKIQNPNKKNLLIIIIIIFFHAGMPGQQACQHAPIEDIFCCMHFILYLSIIIRG